MNVMLAAAAGEVSSGWLDKLSGVVDTVNGYVWGMPLILTVLVAGVMVTSYLRMEHLFHLKRAL